MVDSLKLPQTQDRAALYAAILPQVEAVISDESDLVANQANIAAILKEAFGFLWVGFYWVKDGCLVLGPFQGPLACTRIAFDQGVCGNAYRTQKTVVVADVNQFAGHIACSSLAQSEIVVPVFSARREVVGVLDVDSEQIGYFSESDVLGLEAIVRIFEPTLKHE